MRINIFGAAGAGSTTVGEALAKRLGYAYFDSDDYFWITTDVPFSKRREEAERNFKAKKDLEKKGSWILGGSVMNWELGVPFDLSVFLYIPQELRLERLRARELQRYGNIIFTDSLRNRLYQEYMNWATGYDDNTTKGRTLALHHTYMKKMSEPLLIINGDTSIEQRIDLIVSKIKELGAKI